MPSLRSRILRRGLVAAITVLRRAGAGSPDPEGPVEELEAYALRLRAQMEALGNQLPPSRGSHAVTAQRSPVPSLWVASERVVGDLAAAHGVPVERIVGEGASDPELLARAERITLHAHGGAYCMGSPVTHRGLGGALTRTTHGAVLLPDYRLAPEDPFPAALDDVVATYRWLVDDLGVDPGRLAVSGDSAGGGLAAALLVRLRDEGRPLPACFVGMSPWVDLAATGGSMSELASVDPWLTAGLVLPAGRAYAGDTPLDHPHVSPLYADLRGLPPMLVHVGSDEILLDDAIRLVERASAAGVDASLGRFDGLWHVFQAFPGMPESRDSLREIGGFIRRHTAPAALPRAAGAPLRRTA